MPSEPSPLEPAHYASLRLRILAFRIDLLIYLGFFLAGGLLTGILFENLVSLRISVSVALLLVLLAYEPYMISLHGGTFGHQKSNIRIVSAETGEALPLWRAIVRSLTKQFFGLISVVFMFVTRRAQGLHDIVAGSRVVLRDPTRASRGDAYIPTAPLGDRASPLRRIVVIVGYNLALVLVLSFMNSASISQPCLQSNVCSGSEDSISTIIGTVWLITVGLSIALGWTGRLPGCRASVAS